jgi:GT2 family glycosyltransferase
MRHPNHGQRWTGMPAAPIRLVDGLMGCAVMAKRRVFESVGLLTEEYFFGLEDLDLCLRARAHGLTSACIGGATVLHAGSGAMGRRSPVRAYYGVRNQLLVASRVFAAQSLPARTLRAIAIIGFNLAYVARQSDMPRLAALRSVLRGVSDHLAGRYGARFPKDRPSPPPSRRLKSSRGKT